MAETAKRNGAGAPAARITSLSAAAPAVPPAAQGGSGAAAAPIAPAARITPAARIGPRAAALLVGLALLAGCSSAGSLFHRGGRETSESAPEPRASANESSSVDTGGLAVYLTTLQRLVSSDSLTQAEVFNRLRDADEFAPTKQNRLLYALALAVPGHPRADPAEGARRLRDLIAAGDTLAPEERMLAQIVLQTANRLDVLQTATLESEERLASAVAGRESELNAEHEAELARARDENEQLRRELDEVNAMLDAITNIERSISEREAP